ncbi:hypothetical protein O181_028321 [Austropuccinia psidii MF-1]|uniref:Uncharacterized protein n=1 Tax=Austropuccinia psidii MF-1 TaxID=1389203 RepID=A0A9Q3H296_9BASI|nr:hypothetical protein [Austropuccinia psidii MF-1]
MEQVFGKKSNVTSFNQFDATSDSENKNGSGSEAPSQGEFREESLSGLDAYEQTQRAVQKGQAANKANRSVCGEGNHGNNVNESPSGLMGIDKTFPNGVTFLCKKMVSSWTRRIVNYVAR